MCLLTLLSKPGLVVISWTSYDTLPVPLAMLVLASKGATMWLETVELSERSGQQATGLPKDKYPSVVTCNTGTGKDHRPVQHHPSHPQK